MTTDTIKRAATIKAYHRIKDLDRHRADLAEKRRKNLARIAELDNELALTASSLSQYERDVRSWNDWQSFKAIVADVEEDIANQTGAIR